MKRKIGEDGQLIRRYLLGDEKAFSLLVAKYRTKVFTTIYLIVRNPTDAEDLTQECFHKVVQVLKSGRYRDEGRFLPWMLRIAHNKAVDHYRKVKNRPEYAVEQFPEWSESLKGLEKSPEELRIEKERVAMLNDWIEALPDKQKEVLRMRSFRRMSYGDIAEETGTSVNTALGRMRYAMKFLKKAALCQA
ncbi:RNA polymerase subunit sigma-24 [Fulvitalea axinellae]|uniref:RNA polymerase subunit sigma-24 n=1 Tax=Fulvitalea axinellae TaxID=1182444 RepID=A0AAU9CG58_9BACT|nr:RNA polymerase subunit sigma-24 [Fulvitalea axinellae]